MFSVGKETSFCWVTEHLDPPNQRTQEFAGSLPPSSSLTDSLCHYQGAASSRKYLFGISCFFREAGDCRTVFLMLSPKAAFLELPTVWILVLPLTVICMSVPSSFSSSSSSSFSFGVDRVSGLFIKVTCVHGSNLESTTHNTWHIHTTQHTVLLCSFILKCILSCLVMADSVTPCTVACHVPLSPEFSRQEYLSGLPFPPPLPWSNNK